MTTGAGVLITTRCSGAAEPVAVGATRLETSRTNCASAAAGLRWWTTSGRPEVAGRTSDASTGAGVADVALAAVATGVDAEAG